MVVQWYVPEIVSSCGNGNKNEKNEKRMKESQKILTVMGHQLIGRVKTASFSSNDETNESQPSSVYRILLICMMLLWALKKTIFFTFIASSCLVSKRYLPAWLSWSILSMQNTTTPLRTIYINVCDDAFSSRADVTNDFSFLPSSYIFSSTSSKCVADCFLCVPIEFTHFLWALTVLSVDVVLIGLGVAQTGFRIIHFMGIHISFEFFFSFLHRAPLQEISQSYFMPFQFWNKKKFYNGIKHLHKMVWVKFWTYFCCLRNSLLFLSVGVVQVMLCKWLEPLRLSFNCWELIG